MYFEFVINVVFMLLVQINEKEQFYTLLNLSQRNIFLYVYGRIFQYIIIIVFYLYFYGKQTH